MLVYQRLNRTTFFFAGSSNGYEATLVSEGAESSTQAAYLNPKFQHESMFQPKTWDQNQLLFILAVDFLLAIHKAEIKHEPSK